MVDILDAAGHEAEANARDWPAYPMRKESGDEHKGMSWQRPSQQEATVEILHSNERPNLSAVFGTALPPNGLSGLFRRWAFRFSESNGAHWVILILADRINVVEGLLEDFGKGHVPNVPYEMGMKSDIRHNPRGFALKAALAALVIGGATVWAVRSVRRRPVKGFTRSRI